VSVKTKAPTYFFQLLFFHLVVFLLLMQELFDFLILLLIHMLLELSVVVLAGLRLLVEFLLMALEQPLKLLVELIS